MRYGWAVRLGNDANGRGSRFFRPVEGPTAKAKGRDRGVAGTGPRGCRSPAGDLAGFVHDKPRPVLVDTDVDMSLSQAKSVLSCLFGAFGEMKPILPEKRSLRGSAAPIIIAIVLVLAALAGGAWWYFTQRDAAAPAVVAPGQPTPSATTEDEAAPIVSAAVEELSIDQLYREARSAMSEQRVVAPAGNNAMEYYLAIIGKDPTNSGAADALRELFPFASGTAEQEIIQGNIVEAD